MTRFSYKWKAGETGERNNRRTTEDEPSSNPPLHTTDNEQQQPSLSQDQPTCSTSSFRSAVDLVAYNERDGINGPSSNGHVFRVPGNGINTATLRDFELLRNQPVLSRMARKSTSNIHSRAFINSTNSLRQTLNRRRTEERIQIVPLTSRPISTRVINRPTRITVSTLQGTMTPVVTRSRANHLTPTDQQNNSDVQSQVPVTATSVGTEAAAPRSRTKRSCTVTSTGVSQESVLPTISLPRVSSRRQSTPLATTSNGQLGKESPVKEKRLELEGKRLQRNVNSFVNLLSNERSPSSTQPFIRYLIGSHQLPSTSTTSSDTNGTASSSTATSVPPATQTMNNDDTLHDTGSSEPMDTEITTTALVPMNPPTEAANAPSTSRNSTVNGIDNATSAANNNDPATPTSSTSQLGRRRKTHYNHLGPIATEPPKKKQNKTKKVQKHEVKKSFRNFQKIRNLLTRSGICNSFDEYVHLNAIENILIKLYTTMDNSDVVDGSINHTINSSSVEEDGDTSSQSQLNQTESPSIHPEVQINQSVVLEQPSTSAMSLQLSLITVPQPASANSITSNILLPVEPSTPATTVDTIVEPTAQSTFISQISRPNPVVETPRQTVADILAPITTASQRHSSMAQASNRQTSVPTLMLRHPPPNAPKTASKPPSRPIPSATVTQASPRQIPTPPVTQASSRQTATVTQASASPAATLSQASSRQTTVTQAPSRETATVTQASAVEPPSTISQAIENPTLRLLPTVPTQTTTTPSLPRSSTDTAIDSMLSRIRNQEATASSEQGSIRIRPNEYLFSSDEEGDDETPGVNAVYREISSQLVEMGFQPARDTTLQQIVKNCNGNIDLCIDMLSQIPENQ